MDVKIFIDNILALALAKNSVFHDQSKHIDTRYHFIRDCVTTKEVELQFIKSQDHIADIFIKHSSLNFFNYVKSFFENCNYYVGDMNLATHVCLYKLMYCISSDKVE